jgi:hypothetical protein
LQALHVSLGEVRIVTRGEGSVIGPDGEVDVPQVDPFAAEKLRLSRLVDGPALGESTMVRLRERIELLALAAQAPRLALEVPQTHFEAVNDVNRAGWIAAMDMEMGSMEEFGVWKLVQLPAGKNLMTCKWVFSLKRDVAGTVT